MGSGEVLSVWLITGSTGIGAATARLAAQRGARVFVCGLDIEATKSLAAELGDASAWHAGDLAMPESAEWAVKACLERYGQLDAVFNVAGGSGRKFGDGPMHELDAEAWEQTLRLNLTPTANVCREALRHMLPRRSGSILNMASVTAVSPEPRHFATHAYAAAKGAVIALTQSMAAYYAPSGIRVNAIAPGLVRTPMSLRAQSDETIQQFIRAKQPLTQGMIEPGEIARVAAFLLSEDASTITGEVVMADAAWRWS